MIDWFLIIMIFLKKQKLMIHLQWKWSKFKSRNMKLNINEFL